MKSLRNRLKNPKNPDNLIKKRWKNGEKGSHRSSVKKTASIRSGFGWCCFL
jgi:hypothetical protein